MKCLSCFKRKAQLQPIVGYTYCKVCIDKQRKLPKLGETIELTTESIREERKKYKQEILQRYKGDGTASREYIKQYGDKGFTKDEVKNSKNVWSENSYYKDD